MFVINEDNSIYVTRGDAVYFVVTAEDNGEEYVFKAGDVVRINVFEKKSCENVVLSKVFTIEEETTSVGITLESGETKIGDVISKPTDYWYEIELNPFTRPQTIIGYDDDGAKVFKLFPEGDNNGDIEEEDIPVVDGELDETSTRPVENQAVTRELIAINKELKSLKGRITKGEEELADARVDKDGNTHENVGEHIRTVTKDLVERTTKKNSVVLTSEFLNVAKSYYNARWSDEEETIPTFIYSFGNTVLDSGYDATDDTYSRAIDCSTYVGLVLRGIPYEKSPYYSAGTATAVADVTVEDGDEIDEETYLPSDLVANNLEYNWAINPFEWRNKVVNLTKPVRTASQLAQWMYENGWDIPLDSNFTHLQPGDIIFWAKKKSDGTYKQPNRYKKISHVALCYNVMDAPTDEEDFPAGYTKKHTMMEVTSISPYVLNRTLERCAPEEVVMICRPDLGSLTVGEFAGNITSQLGITDISELYRPGIFYLTSDVTAGLPDGIAKGTYCTLRVEKTQRRAGETYSLIQTLFNASTNGAEYRRTQYCYSHEPNTTDWTEWKCIALPELSLDAALSTTSENPVQNKVITAKFNELSEQIASLVDGNEVEY